MKLDSNRYYFSLVAVFLALGLGMILGSSWVRDESWLGEQKSLIQAIEAEFETLRSENKEYRERIAGKEEELVLLQSEFKNLLKQAYKNQFELKNLLVIKDESLAEDKNSLENFLKELGFEVEFFSGALEEKEFLEESTLILWGEEKTNLNLDGKKGVAWAGHPENPLELKELLEKIEGIGH